MRIASAGLKTSFALFLAALCSLFFLGSSLRLAHAESSYVSYEEKKRQANDIAVNIIVSGLSCTCARFAEDMRNVLNDLRPDGLRILPVLGVGGLQNLNDVLFLKNIDMGVVDEDNLRFLKVRDPRLYGNIEQRVQYITKLYNSEFQVLARNDIKTYDDLRGQKVNFNLKDSQTEVSADFIFKKLNLDVVRSNYDNDEAIKMVKSGDLAAMIILTGAPQASFAKLKAEDGVHFLALDKEQLASHDLKPIFDYYLPAELTHEMYPALVPQGTTVPTVANRALLVAYSWPENSPRYKKLAKFVREFFGKIDQFHDPARHPKWKEVSLSADIPGWTRFRPAADWLAEHRSLMAQQGQQRDFNAFLASADKGMPRSQAERDALFREFLQWRDRQARHQ
jgi:TRAP-type uncharacterized transport system substrate-binding protein